MDIVHHGMIGIIGLAAAEAAGEPLVGVFFLMGSVLPDLDVLLMVFGKRIYLKNHQGPTHSLILMPLFAVTGVLLLSWYEPFSWLNVAALAAGLCLHIVLDYSNTYGISLFYPLNRRRYAMDAVFFIDAVLIVLTLSALLLQYPVWFYAALFAVYVLVKSVMHRHVLKILQAGYAIPSAWNPFDFYIYVNRGDRIETSLYNVLTGKKRHSREQKNIDAAYRHLTAKSQVFSDLKMVTKALHITAAERGEDGMRIEAKDLALRNFGGKFATTTLKFDKEGRLISEVSNI